MGKFCGNCFNNTLNEQNICTLCGFDGGYNRRLAPHALPAGAILNGRYIIGRILGQGGFGITYTARDHQTGELVAVKEFYPDSMVTRTDLTEVTPFLGERGENFAYGKETFLQEAETMAQFIGNPNIVRVYSYFEENGTAYFVMEYVDGVSYLDYLKQRGGKIEFADALKILLPVMDALSAVHEKNIIHRDVTPDNIYISKDGTVKLLDFGAARYSLGNASRSLDVILKHGFAPREQYKRRGRQGPYTDVYSLGATLYYSVTGIRPDDALERVDEDLVALPSTLGVTISKEQEAALMKAMALDPENRYQTMAEFRDALMCAKPAAKQAKKPETPRTPVNQKPVPVRKPKQKKKVNWLIPAVAAVLVCIAGAVFVLNRKPDSPALSTKPTQTGETQQTLPAVTPDAIPDPLSPEAIAYNEAVYLFYQGEYGKAAIAFGKLGDFQDAREISFRIWDAVADRNTISAGNRSGIAIKNYGTVLIANDNQKRNVSAWDNIISVSTASDNDTVALKSDGTVVATQYGDKARETAVSEWRDIVSISTGGVHTVGLKVDGTVVAAGVNEQTDGTYIGCCDISEWTDIIDVAAGYRFTVALKADGTVVKTGVDVNNVYEITKWKDIVDIEAGISHIAGLKADGTVVAVGWDSAGETKVSHWQDITAISAGYYHTLGLRSDGTVVGAGNKNNNRYNVSGWKDIVSVAAGQSILIGLHPDGTVSSAGKLPDWVADWKDIRLPADRDALLSQIHLDYIT